MDTNPCSGIGYVAALARFLKSRVHSLCARKPWSFLCQASGVPCSRVVVDPHNSISCVSCQRALRRNTRGCFNIYDMAIHRCDCVFRERNALRQSQHRTSPPTVCTTIMVACHLQICRRRQFVFSAQRSCMKMFAALGYFCECCSKMALVH